MARIEQRRMVVEDQLGRQRGWYSTFLLDNTPICLHYQSLNLPAIDPAAYGEHFNRDSDQPLNLCLHICFSDPLHRFNFPPAGTQTWRDCAVCGKPHSWFRYIRLNQLHHEALKPHKLLQLQTSQTVKYGSESLSGVRTAECQRTLC